MFRFNHCIVVYSIGNNILQIARVLQINNTIKLSLASVYMNDFIISTCIFHVVVFHNLFLISFIKITFILHMFKLIYLIYLIHVSVHALFVSFFKTFVVKCICSIYKIYIIGIFLQFYCLLMKINTMWQKNDDSFIMLNC